MKNSGVPSFRMPEYQRKRFGYDYLQKRLGDVFMEHTKKVRDRLGRGRFCSTYTYVMLSIAGILSFLVLWELLISMGLILSLIHI